MFHETLRAEIEAAVVSDLAAGRRRSESEILEALLGEPVPVLGPEYRELKAWGYRLGRDERGVSLLTEREAALRALGLSDPGLVDLAHRAFDAVDAGFRRAQRAALARASGRADG